eukprot:587775-Amphidinium_carterae.1
MATKLFRLSCVLHMACDVGHCCACQSYRSTLCPPQPGKPQQVHESKPPLVASLGAGNGPCSLTQAGVSALSAGNATCRLSLSQWGHLKTVWE